MPGQGLSFPAASAESYDTRTIAAASFVPISRTALRTNGYAAVGDGGGAYYVKVGATTPGGFQSADGAWWQYVIDGESVDVRSFGAKCDGTTDDAAAINAAILASVDGSSRGGTIIFPSGRQCAIGSTIAFYDFYTGLFKGNNVTFVWTGNATDPMFRIRNTQFYTFRDFRVTNESGKTLIAVFQSDTNTGSRVNSQNSFHNISIASYNAIPAIGKGWWFSIGTGGDANNDFNLFVGCTVYYTTVAAWSFEHPQSCGHVFLKCTFLSCVRGVATTLGTGTYGGSFNFYGGGGGSSTVADFQIGKHVGSPMTISGVHTEASARFIEMTGGADMLCKPVLIECNEITTSNIHADGYIMVFNGPGPFNVNANRISGVNACHIKLNSASLCSFNMAGCVFDTPSSSVQGTIIDALGAGPFDINRSGNIFRDAGNLPAVRSDDDLLRLGTSSLLWGTVGAEDVGLTKFGANGIKISSGVSAGYGTISASIVYTRATAGDAQRARISGPSMSLAQDGSVGFTNGAAASDTLDTGFSRGSAGRIFIGNGAQGDKSAYLDAKAVVTAPVAIASLPAAATALTGARMCVNDALTPTFGSAVVAGGAVTVPVYSNGSAWIVG